MDRATLDDPVRLGKFKAMLLASLARLDAKEAAEKGAAATTKKAS